MKIQFSVLGNQRDPRGNPCAFERTIHNASAVHSPQYLDWQRHVRQCYYDQVRAMGEPVIIDDAYVRNPESPRHLAAANVSIKPIVLSSCRATVKVNIRWSKYSANALDVLSSILSALFADTSAITSVELTSAPILGDGVAEVSIEFSDK
jgi:hypothetical protein